MIVIIKEYQVQDIGTYPVKSEILQPDHLVHCKSSADKSTCKMPRASPGSEEPPTGTLRVTTDTRGNMTFVA